MPLSLERLKERKVFQWTVAYLAAAVVAAEALNMFGDRFHWPEWLLQAILVLLALGVPLVLVLAWHHGERGRQRIVASEWLALGAIAALAVGSVWWVWSRAPEEPASTAWGLPETPTPTERRIAILPLANLSPAAEADAYLADGFHEELITQVMKIGALDVLARTSVMAFREPAERRLRQIAQDLGVWYIVEGSIRRDGVQLRVTAQLIDARDERLLWTDTYDRRYQAAAMFEMQSDVAIEIARALEKNLAPEERTRIETRPTENDEAYFAYLRGLHSHTGSSATTLEGNAHFLRAVELDPTFAEAWAYLGNTYAAMGNFYLAPPPEVFPLAKEAAYRALELDGSVARAYTALAWAHMTFERDWDAAGAALQDAIELNPNLMEAHYQRAYWLQAMGRFDEAIREGERSVELDPLNASTHRALARMLHIARRFEAAAALFRRSIEMDPRATGAHFYLALSLEQMGRPHEAMLEIQRAALGDGRDTTEVAALEERFAEAGMAAMWGQWLSWHLDSPTQRPGPIAISYARLGRADEAFQWIERACDRYDSWMFQLNDPLWDPIRNDPRFAQLRRTLNFPEGP